MSLEFSKEAAYEIIDETVKRLKKQIELWPGDVVVLDEDRPVLRHAYGTSKDNLIGDVSIRAVPK